LPEAAPAAALGTAAFGAAGAGALFDHGRAPPRRSVPRAPGSGFLAAATVALVAALALGTLAALGMAMNSALPGTPA
jgi:hypothetical protein